MLTKMSKHQRTRRIASEKLRGFLAEIAEQICAAQDHVTLALAGNTFEIRLEGATINVNITEKGGAK